MKDAIRQKKTFFARGASFLLILFFGSVFFPHGAFAQEERYFYKSVDAVFEIKDDSTVQVTETQTYSFADNEFHQGWRSVSLRGTGGITDISVKEPSTGKLFVYSRSRLEKTDAKNWGKYTTYKENGNQIIEWYYDISKENAPLEKTWTISYVVHGSIEFGSEYNRFYWNVFTDYDVPVKEGRVRAVLPESYDEKEVSGFFYRSSQNEAQKLSFTNTNEFSFEEFNFYSGEKFTIDVSWKKGIPTMGAYVADFMKMNFGTVASVCVFFFALLYGFIYWHRGKKREEASIVPEYEPPKGIPPLFAELILKERISPKGFSSTIVDLAVRGYIRIKEEEHKILFWKKRRYSLELLKDVGEYPELQDFEQSYMRMLFKHGHVFSLDELRGNRMRQTEFSNEIKKLESDILKELDSDTRAFAKGGIHKEKYFYLSLVGSALFFGIFWILGSKFVSSNYGLQFLAIAVTAVSVGFALWAFVRFEAELSEYGIALKRKLLGFKMFLSITEKDRVKKLTPDMFEKYLPYAMIFGVEKKWAQTFEGIHLPAPEWVSVPLTAHAATDGMVSMFSPSAFSASFSSAFTSAIATSGASGASGGGSAGGGSGGGGGGAS